MLLRWTQTWSEGIRDLRKCACVHVVHRGRYCGQEEPMRTQGLDTHLLGPPLAFLLQLLQDTQKSLSLSEVTLQGL